MRWQSACFVLFCATVREVFTDELTESRLAKRIGLLGTARAQLAVDPHAAWRAVCDVRDRYDCLPLDGVVQGHTAVTPVRGRSGRL